MTHRAPLRRFDPPALYAALDEERQRRRLSWAQVADESGVAASTIQRLREHGRFETDGIVALAAWAGRPVDDFTRPGDLSPEDLRRAAQAPRESSELGEQQVEGGE